ncbi:hypothetical protein LRQ08_29835 (plasmid) [Rhodococcus qingshengii]|uniref:hypothetical protein n=1 Tax=Rhodococcus qingshengii TaxID=334542 RepID=UPI002112EB08|nr:hypothetical protein [Rhodococcus qingshengii]UUE28659.1 hypothetical protein LRQ08_29835 [Rhodococcus qingshengii]
MLRLNLGELIEWEDSEYTVAASTGAATLLYRLANGARVWVDLATLAGAGDLSFHPKVQLVGLELGTLLRPHLDENLRRHFPSATT